MIWRSTVQSPNTSVRRGSVTDTKRLCTFCSRPGTASASGSVSSFHTSCPRTFCGCSRISICARSTTKEWHASCMDLPWCPCFINVRVSLLCDTSCFVCQPTATWWQAPTFVLVVSVRWCHFVVGALPSYLRWLHRSPRAVRCVCVRVGGAICCGSHVIHRFRLHIGTMSPCSYPLHTHHARLSL